MAFIDAVSTMKIGGKTEPNQRQQVAAVLAEFLVQPSGATDISWLKEKRARGIPLFGTMAAVPGEIVRLASR